jgi:hypothetical protein
MYLSKYMQYLGGSQTVNPETTSYMSGMLPLHGVVEWGVFVSLTYSEIPTTPADLEIYGFYPDGGVFLLQSATLAAPEDTDPHWYYVEAESSVPVVVTTKIKNPDTAATITVNKTMAVVARITDVKQVLSPSEWIQAWGMMM